MLIFQVLLLLTIGHFTAALLVYLNHRFVFHGELGTKGPLKFIRRYHTLHHAHPKGERVYDHIYMPMWARMMFIAIYVGISFVSFSFALGMLTFSMYYGYNHLAIHEKKHRNHSYFHHMLHHKDPTVNFSGMYPFIDKLFSTYKESRPIL